MSSGARGLCCGFHRRSDKALLGGVCAGAAEYFGANLKVVRILVVISFLVMPATILAYVAAVVLLPATAQKHAKKSRADNRRAKHAAHRQTVADVNRRFKSLSRRLARLEETITSSRYQLDREFRNL